MDWSIVWIALVINFLVVRAIPKIITKPTGFVPVDDVVLYLNTQDGFLVSSSLVLVFVLWATHTWMESSPAATVASSPVV